MAVFYFYSACVLLLTTPSWPTATGLPVISTLSPEKCGDSFMNLLFNVKDLLRLHSDVLCHGIASDTMEVRSKPDTVLACAPIPTQNSGCMGQRNSSFSESDCLMNIMEDLAHYDAAIKSYINSTLRSHKEEVALRPTLAIIQSLRKNCSLVPNGVHTSSEEDAAQMWGSDTFSNRQKMCKMMRGFHVRTITINRALGYISSGEHRK
ncbi:interleukin-12 subunit alpha [Etheostoma cragini]|uniref:interleukin-12 subunit alpha n=1 Tax=Etheostoma cragini TaxID=417921 RepID=UPI00155EEE20|nr:interleukin-12 subunit alpha [Etheostoma cragini]